MARGEPHLHESAKLDWRSLAEQRGAAIAGFERLGPCNAKYPWFKEIDFVVK
jgi:hypothetical protein